MRRVLLAGMWLGLAIGIGAVILSLFEYIDKSYPNLFFVSMFFIMLVTLFLIIYSNRNK